jgi:PTH1 family peptidyl-tRNA hydrolase
LGKKIIIGLGNPGLKYRKTRHNAGFLLADALAGSFKKDKNCAALVSEDENYIVAKPETYMNKSGLAVKKIVKKYNADIKDILIAYDDFNLSRGKLRIRPGGSAGGHNGLQSVIDTLDTKRIPRLRLGIGGIALRNKIEYVLERFGNREFKEIKDMIIEAKRLIYYYVKYGIADTMNKYN